jgi:hypothetical protein
MGQSSSGDGGGNPYLTAAKIGLSSAAGGLNAASGTTPPQQPPVDFSGVGAAIKKARGPKPVSLNNPTTSVIPQNPNQAVPDLNAPASPMPDLYSGANAQIPQLRKPINGMLPFYGQ